MSKYSDIRPTSAADPLDVLSQALQARIDHVSTHFDDRWDDFGCNPRDPQSLDIVGWLAAEQPALCEKLYVIPGTLWRRTINRHFRRTPAVSHYEATIRDDQLYDAFAKIGDKPLTTKEVMRRTEPSI